MLYVKCDTVIEENNLIWEINSLQLFLMLIYQGKIVFIVYALI